MVKESDFKIGIVDDHVQSAVFIANMLENQGFKTFQAYNLQDALEMIKEENPDLILVDLNLGHNTGYELASQIPKSKIILMTGFEVDNKIISKVKNIIGVVTKPIEIKKVIGKVRDILKVPEKKEILLSV